MKHKLKFAFLISFLLLVSGCEGTYQITINKDLSVKESMTMTEERSVIETYTNKFNQYGNVLITDLKEVYPNYSMNSQANENSLDGSGTKTFQTLELYASDSALKKTAFKTVNITTADNLVTIQLKDFDINNYLLTSDEIYGAVFKELTLEIKSTYQVENSNAEEVDKEENIYRWKFTENKLPEEINLVINKGVLFNPPLWTNNTLLMVAILGGIVIVLVTVTIVFVGKARQNNRM